MLVAASTSCLSNVPFRDVFDQFADLEYSCIEIVVGNNGILRPEEIQPNFDTIVHQSRLSRRVAPIAFYFDVEPSDPKYVEHFTAVCRLAKATKIVVMTIRSALLGTPFNKEVERLAQLVRIGTEEGVLVGLLTELGRYSESPENVVSFCKNIPGLAVTLDPSHYIYNCPKPKDYDSFIHDVCHVRLRDTKKEAFQVRIGQGDVEFNKLVTMLTKVGYQRALCADLSPLPDVDSLAELRKMRLLLESWL